MILENTSQQNNFLLLVAGMMAETDQRGRLIAKWRKRAMSIKKFRFALPIVTALIVVLLIQIFPYGGNHSNLSIVRELSWDNASTRALAKRACFDCHSYETTWPWYSRIAPMSWLVQYDVDSGLKKLNFSDWRFGARKGERPDKIEKEIREGDMPPFLYRLARPNSRLSDAEKNLLIDGLTDSIRRH
jgi:hypothetical protein